MRTPSAKAKPVRAWKRHQRHKKTVASYHLPYDHTLRAQITKRGYPHLLRHSVPTTLLERGMRSSSGQTFLGHSKHETTQRYCVSARDDAGELSAGVAR